MHIKHTLSLLVAYILLCSYSGVTKKGSFGYLIIASTECVSCLLIIRIRDARMKAAKSWNGRAGERRRNEGPGSGERRMKVKSIKSANQPGANQEKAINTFYHAFVKVNTLLRKQSIFQRGVFAYR